MFIISNENAVLIVIMLKLKKRLKYKWIYKATHPKKLNRNNTNDFWNLPIVWVFSVAHDDFVSIYATEFQNFAQHLETNQTKRSLVTPEAHKIICILSLFIVYRVLQASLHFLCRNVEVLSSWKSLYKSDLEHPNFTKFLKRIPN